MKENQTAPSGLENDETRQLKTEPDSIIGKKMTKYASPKASQRAQ